MDMNLQDVFAKFAKARGEEDKVKVVYVGGFSRFGDEGGVAVFSGGGEGVGLSQCWLKSCKSCSRASFSVM